MADDLKEVKNAIITGNLMQQDENDTRSIYSLDLPLKSLQDIEETVEQFLKIPENFERSVIYVL